MYYKNAADVLPREVLQMIQKFAQGEYLYIPQQKDTRRSWGEKSGARAEMRARNAQIKRAWQGGDSFDTLARRYHLSTARIRQIVYEI